MKNIIIYRETCDNKREYLILNTTKKIEVIEAKKWARHGDLVDQDMAGNGYHGRCCNCGMPLVTDLGYNSWANTTCERKRKVNTITTEKKVWTKFRNKASTFIKDDANKYQSELLHEQGWGIYNFHCIIK